MLNSTQHDSLRGTRIGEAKHPGPGHFDDAEAEMDEEESDDDGPPGLCGDCSDDEGSPDIGHYREAELEWPSAMPQPDPRPTDSPLQVPEAARAAGFLTAKEIQGSAEDWVFRVGPLGTGHY